MPKSSFNNPVLKSNTFQLLLSFKPVCSMHLWNWSCVHYIDFIQDVKWKWSMNLHSNSTFFLYSTCTYNTSHIQAYNYTCSLKHRYKHILLMPLKMFVHGYCVSRCAYISHHVSPVSSENEPRCSWPIHTILQIVLQPYVLLGAPPEHMLSAHHHKMDWSIFKSKPIVW